MKHINKFERNDKSLVNTLSYITIKNICLKEASEKEFENFMNNYPKKLEEVSLFLDGEHLIMYFDPKVLSYNSFNSNTGEMRCQMVAQVVECPLCKHRQQYKIWEKTTDEIYDLFIKSNVITTW